MSADRRAMPAAEFKAQVEHLSECIATALAEMQCDAVIGLVALEMVARSIRSLTERKLLAEEGAFAEFELQMAKHFDRLKEKPLAGAS